MKNQALRKKQGHPRLRQTLRDSTRDAHDRIEALWASESRFSSLATYRAFLATLLDVHRRVGLPAALVRGDPAEFALENDRIAALSSDLDFAPPPAKSETRALSEGQAWGVGYVLNGSAIGADMILRSAYLEPEWPNRYLALGRDYVRNGALQGFFRALGVACVEPQDVMRGAIETFEMFDTKVSVIGEGR